MCWWLFVWFGLGLPFFPFVGRCLVLCLLPWVLCLLLGVLWLFGARISQVSLQYLALSTQTRASSECSASRMR